MYVYADVLRAASAATFTVVLTAVSTAAAAQGLVRPDMALTVQGLASVQPSVGTYGPPYLDKGLGGIGPGLAVGIEGSARGFVAGAEFSTATIEVDHTGRAVGGAATGRLRDSLISFRAGAILGASQEASVAGVAGLSIVAGTPALDGVPIEPSFVANGQRGTPGRLAFTAGLHGDRRFGGRASLLISVRYSDRSRDRAAEALEVGPHIVRLGVGIRFRMRG